MSVVFTSNMLELENHIVQSNVLTFIHSIKI